MSAYQNILIYYFSGTGNALQAARWIEANAARESIPAKLLSIEKLEKNHHVENKGKTLIGFCYPTHGFCAPWLILKFICSFPRLSNTDVFFVNTRAGMKLAGIYVPGLSGVAQWFSILVFFLKGFNIKGSLPLDMPHSWISFFPPNTEKGSHAIIARCKRIVDKMCTSVFKGKKYYRYSVWTSLPFDLALIPVTIGYVFCFRFLLAKTLFTSLKCNTCRLCEASCPVQAITIKDNRPYWKYTCESCMRCMNICPKRSIQSWVTRLTVIFYLLSIAFFSFTTLNSWVVFIIVNALIFPIYWLLFRMLSFRAVNAFFTYSSLTSYWKRYLTPGIKIKDFNANIKELLLKKNTTIKDSALKKIED